MRVGDAPSMRAIKDRTDVDRLICHCMVVSEREVLACIRAGAQTVDDVAERCEAGSGCGSCRGGIEILIAQQRRRASAKATPAAVLAQLGLFAGGKPPFSRGDD
jgi:bacterioferritin-associated ferredoxin